MPLPDGPEFGSTAFHETEVLAQWKRLMPAMRVLSSAICCVEVLHT